MSESMYYRLLFCFLVALSLSGRSSAQTVCPNKNGDSRPNSQYPEIDSSCVHVSQEAGLTKIWSDVPGSKKPTKETDPVCTDAQWEVVCRRICGDLPPGKTPEKIVGTGIVPPGYGRFEERLETFQTGDHVRVCIRVKNWGNSSFGVGTVKTFTYSVSYKNP